jgi:hypothetical protein
MGYLEWDVSDLMAAAKMKEHAPYTEADWQADFERVDQGEPLTCPDCGALGDYGPRDDGQGRHYRACKMCGFWQEADGSPAYRCWMSTHKCDPGLDAHLVLPEVKASGTGTFESTLHRLRATRR